MLVDTFFTIQEDYNLEIKEIQEDYNLEINLEIKEITQFVMIQFGDQ